MAKDVRIHAKAAFCINKLMRPHVTQIQEVTIMFFEQVGYKLPSELTHPHCNTMVSRCRITSGNVDYFALHHLQLMTLA